MAHETGRRASAPGGGARAWRVTGLALVGALLGSGVRFGIGAGAARTCGTVTIRNGTANPGSGTTATTFSFAVQFSDATGAAPASVTRGIAATATRLHTTQ